MKLLKLSLCLVILLALLCGCSGKRILGTWQLCDDISDFDKTLVFIFQDDGFVTIVDYNTVPYRLKGNTLYIDDPNYPVELEYEIDGEYMYLSDDVMVMKFIRVIEQ